MAKVKAVYSSGTKFKRIAQALARINDEGILYFNKDGLLSWFFSPDKTVLGVFRVSSTAFDELSIDNDISITLDMSELSKVLKRSTRNDKISMEYSTGNSFMRVTLIDEKTGVERSFEVSAGESEENKLKEIKMSPTARFVLSSDDINTLIKDADLISDSIKITGKDDKIIVESNSEERFYQWIMKKDNPLQEINIEEEAISTYSLNALKASVEPITTVAESVTLEFSTDFPLKIEFSISGPEEFVMYIAPIST